MSGGEPLRVPRVAAIAQEGDGGRNRSSSVPNSFCFASDILAEQPQRTSVGPLTSEVDSPVADAPSWLEFLRECGVDPKDALVAGAVRVTAKRQLKRQGKFLPEDSDVSRLSRQERTELVSLIREALAQLRK